MKLTWGDAWVKLKRLSLPHLGDCCWAGALELSGLSIASVFWDRCCPLLVLCCIHFTCSRPTLCDLSTGCVFCLSVNILYKGLSHLLDLSASILCVYTYMGTALYHILLPYEQGYDDTCMYFTYCYVLCVYYMYLNVLKSTLLIGVITHI